MELTTGIHKDRHLPIFDGGVEDNFSSGTVGYTRGDIIYFPGCFASYHSRTGEYRSSLALLRALGYRVKVIDGICCGVARLTVGDLEGFKTRAGELIDRIDEVAQNGGKICFSSPSCLMCVREEYPRYLDGERAREVASRSFDILELIDEGGDLLWGSGEVDTGVEDVTLHVPCHLHTNGLRETFLRVMSNIPGVQVVDVNDRCCGLAGTFGLRKERFEQSMKIGMTLFRDLEKNHEVITPCGACKMQIEQGSQSKVAHPVQLIAKQCITETSKSHIEEVGCR
jgi:Fe-S oxidoreductase